MGCGCRKIETKTISKDKPSELFVDKEGNIHGTGIVPFKEEQYIPSTQGVTKIRRLIWKRVLEMVL